MFDQLTNQLGDENYNLNNVPVTALNISALLQDKELHSTLLNGLKEKAAIQKAEEKPLPSSVFKANEKLEGTAKAFESSSKELKDAADSLKQFYAGGSPDAGWLHEKSVKAKNVLSFFFGQQQEIPIRNELQRVLNLGGLGAEAQAQGGAVRSNAMVSLATKYIPDVWSNPDAAIEKAQLTAEVKDRLAKINKAEAEWNSQFRGSQNATKNETVSGISVSKGQSKEDFIKALTEYTFPKNEEVNAPALKSMIGNKGTEPAPRKGKQTVPKSGQRVPGTNATFELLPE